MKKYMIPAFALVLCATLFTGCRSRNDVNNTMRPDTGVTTTPTAVTTRPTTQPTTAATTEATTVPTETATQVPTDIPHGTENGTNATDGMERRGRGFMPGR